MNTSLEFPEHYSLTLTRVYNTHHYLQYCEDENETPSKEGFFSYIKDDFEEDFALGYHGLSFEDLDDLARYD